MIQSESSYRVNEVEGNVMLFKRKFSVARYRLVEGNIIKRHGLLSEYLSVLKSFKFCYINR